MSKGEPPLGPIDWSTATQGDIIQFDALHYWNGVSDDIELLGTPQGVALISQTCDLVQVSPKDRLLVAPVRECSPEEQSNVRKGRKPLLVLVGESLDLVADLERVVSLPREVLDSRDVVGRTCASQSGKEASQLAIRIGRAFSRFAFPNEVHSVLSKLQRKVVESYTKKTCFADLLARIEEIRVACTDWDSSGRDLTIYVIVPSDLLPPTDMKPAGWTWSLSSVAGLKPSEQPEHLSLERISELILCNFQTGQQAALVELWRMWEELMQAQYLAKTDEHVASIELQVVSGSDLTYDLYVESEILDFSTLSLLGRAIRDPQASLRKPTAVPL